jgi:hypothetical protein
VILSEKTGLAEKVTNIMLLQIRNKISAHIKYWNQFLYLKYYLNFTLSLQLKVFQTLTVALGTEVTLN